MKTSKNFEKLKPMVNKMMAENGGWETLKGMLESDNDPSRPIGMFLGQLVMQLSQILMEEGADIPVSVMLEDGGLVTWILDQLEIHFDLPSEFSDEIFLDVVDIIQAMAEDPAAQGAQATPQGGAPPQGAPPPQGGGLQAMGGQPPMGGM